MTPVTLTSERADQDFDPLSDPHYTQTPEDYRKSITAVPYLEESDTSGSRSPKRMSLGMSQGKSLILTDPDKGGEP